jgi:MFS family permease
MLIAGILLFALASLGCAAAPSIDVLRAGRLLQGVGAAMLMPNSLAVLGSTFSGEEKGRAVGIWAATGAVMGAIGPVLGGWLIDLGSWRAIFLINLPLAIAAILLAWLYVPDDQDNTDEPLDWTGGALATLGLGGLTWALTVGSGDSGWTPSAIVAAILALIMLALFLMAEWWRGDRAMMPLVLFASRSFIGLTLFTFLLYGALGTARANPLCADRSRCLFGNGRWRGAAAVAARAIAHVADDGASRWPAWLAFAADLGLVDHRPRLPAGPQV